MPKRKLGDDMVKIMAVDDEPDIIKLIGRVLKKSGYEFVGCSSGKECLKNYKKEKPDLLILDVMMPGMTGWDVYKEIRKINKTQKILFLTAVTVESDARDTMDELGVSDYLSKPFEPYELTERVKIIFERRG